MVGTFFLIEVPETTIENMLCQVDQVLAEEKGEKWEVLRQSLRAVLHRWGRWRLCDSTELVNASWVSYPRIDMCMISSNRSEHHWYIYIYMYIHIHTSIHIITITSMYVYIYIYRYIDLYISKKNNLKHPFWWPKWWLGWRGSMGCRNTFEARFFSPCFVVGTAWQDLDWLRGVVTGHPHRPGECNLLVVFCSLDCGLKKAKKCAMLKLLTVGSYGRKPPWMFYGLVFENRQSRLVLYIDCWTLATPYTSFLPVKVTGVDCRYAPLRGSGSPSSEPLPTAFTKAKNSLDTLQSGTDKPQYETCPVGM